MRQITTCASPCRRDPRAAAAVARRTGTSARRTAREHVEAELAQDAGSSGFDRPTTASAGRSCCAQRPPSRPDRRVTRGPSGSFEARARDRGTRRHRQVRRPRHARRRDVHRARRDRVAASACGRAWPPARTSATSRSSRTSTTARRRSSTRCSGSRARSARTRTSPSACWTRWTSSARRASRSSPRTRPSATATSKINIVDTPGHADFGGEVERGAADGRRRAAARRRERGAAAADALRPAQGARGAGCP